MTSGAIWVDVGLILGSAIVIAVAGTRMAGLADRLADRTGLGEAITGAVFLNASTSLSGLTATTTAALDGFPSLAIAMSDAGGGYAAGPRAPPGAPDDTARRSRIEVRAPGAFGEAPRPAHAETTVRYQVNATVQLPLLVASLPIASRHDVGVASLLIRELAGSDGAPLRAYQFFAASKPDRARGLNRLGFIREAVKHTRDGPAWIAQFGVVSADRAGSEEAAEQSLEEDTRLLQPYTIIDTVIGPQRAVSSVMDVEL